MADEKDTWGFLKSLHFWQFFAAGLSLGIVVMLARCKIWPFGTIPPPLGNEPSIFEVVLNDRVMIGFMRAGIVAVISYVLVSIPALVVDRRWMKGLTTAGLTADESQTANKTIDYLQGELQAAQEELEWTVGQYDTAQELLLQYEAEEDSTPEVSDNQEGGRADGEG